MWNEASKSLRGVVLCLTTIAAPVVFQDDIGAAQRRPAGPVDLKREQREQELREAKLRTAELGAAAARIDQKRVEAALEQIREDFRQIQIVRNQMVRSLLADKPLDYKLVSSQTEEIHKRAERLKAFLMPPVPEDKTDTRDTQVEFENVEMKEALVRLCNLIAGFIDNPVLKTPDRVDLEQSTRAGGDLLRIIALSTNISRSAEKLGKTAN
jgi:hypothetical protein